MAAGRLIREAKDKRAGMTCSEIMDAIVAARSNEMPDLVKTRVGFRGQIQSMEFAGVEAHTATTRVGEIRGSSIPTVVLPESPYPM
jgi:hypothetical protein